MVPNTVSRLRSIGFNGGQLKALSGRMAQKALRSSFYIRSAGHSQHWNPPALCKASPVEEATSPASPMPPNVVFAAAPIPCPGAKVISHSSMMNAKLEPIAEGFERIADTPESIISHPPWIFL